jgi:branched-chain amino acid transport system substrate-binding protein
MRLRQVLGAVSIVVGLGSVALGGASPAGAGDRNYGPGVSDGEIRIGQTMPYSGPASSWAALGLADAAYFKMVNDRGGVNGRKITLLSLDDGYSPPRTVEQTRRLVENDNVLLIFNPLGTASNSATRKYLNDRKVPQLFVATGASKFGDPAHFPWTMSFSPNYLSEAKVYAKFLLQTKPAGRIAVLYQNDDFGKDYLAGLKAGLGDRAAQMIVAEVTYEVSDPTVDSQIVSLKNSGADVFFNIATPKFAAQAIRRAYDLDWHPLQFLVNVSSSIATVLRPAGAEKAKGIISAAYQKDPNDPQWRDDPAFQEWNAWMDKYNPQADKGDFFNVTGYNVAQTLVQALRQCGDDLSRENVIRQAAALDLPLPMLLPGIKVTTSPTDFRPIKQMQLQKFDGERWILFGDVIEG